MCIVFYKLRYYALYTYAVFQNTLLEVYTYGPMHACYFQLCVCAFMSLCSHTQHTRVHNTHVPATHTCTQHARAHNTTCTHSTTCTHNMHTQHAHTPTYILHYIPYSGLISKKKFSNKYTKFMFQRIYFRTPDLNCRVLLLHINFGGIYFRRETAKRNIRK